MTTPNNRSYYSERLFVWHVISWTPEEAPGPEGVERGSISKEHKMQATRLKRVVSHHKKRQICLRRDRGIGLAMGDTRLELRSIRRMANAWLAVVASCLAADPLLLQRRETETEAAGLLQLQRWIRWSWEFSGETFVIPRLKAMAKYLVYLSVDDGSNRPPAVPSGTLGLGDGRFNFPWLRGCLAAARPTWDGVQQRAKLYQLSRFGRGLPSGGASVLRSALIEHRQNLLRSFSPPEPLVELFKAWLRPRVEKTKLKSVHTSISASADLAHPLSKGGRGTTLRVMLNRFKTVTKQVFDEHTVLSSASFAATWYTDPPEDDTIIYDAFGHECLRYGDLTEDVPLWRVLYRLGKPPREDAKSVAAFIQDEGDWVSQLVVNLCVGGAATRDSLQIRWTDRPQAVVGGFPFWRYPPEGFPLRAQRVKKPKLESVVVAISEEGYKGRIVTKDHAELTILGHFGRSALYALIENESRTTASFHDTLWHVVESIRRLGLRDGVNLSSDLSTASDLISLSFGDAVADVYDEIGPQSFIPFCVRLGSLSRRLLYPADFIGEIGESGWSSSLNPTDRALAEGAERAGARLADILLSAPRDGTYNGIVFKDGFVDIAYFIDGIDGNYHETGLLMGFPTTYSILTLLNLFLLDLSGAISNVGCGYDEKSIEENFDELTTTLVTSSPKQLHTSVAMTQGDDLYSFLPRNVADGYGHLIALAGLKLSPGAHFVSATGAVFTETFACVGGDGLMRNVDVVKTRHCGRSHDRDPRRTVYPEVSCGIATERQLVYRPELQTTFGSFLYAVHRDIYDRYRSSIPLHLPAVVGGLGIAHPRGPGFVWRKRVSGSYKRLVRLAANPAQSLESFLASFLIGGFIRQNNRFSERKTFERETTSVLEHLYGLRVPFREAVNRIALKDHNVTISFQDTTLLADAMVELKLWPPYPEWLKPAVADGSVLRTKGRRHFVGYLKKNGLVPLVHIASAIERVLPFVDLLDGAADMPEPDVRVKMTDVARNVRKRTRAIEGDGPRRKTVEEYAEAIVLKRISLWTFSDNNYVVNVLSKLPSFKFDVVGGTAAGDVRPLRSSSVLTDMLNGPDLPS